MVGRTQHNRKSVWGPVCPGENKGAQDESGGGGADVQDLITTLRIWRGFFPKNNGKSLKGCKQESRKGKGNTFVVCKYHSSVIGVER